MVNMYACVCGLGVKVVECHMLIECLLDNKARERKHVEDSVGHCSALKKICTV